MAESNLFSESVDDLLLTIRPHGSPSSTFPPGLNQTVAWRNPDVSLHAWFTNIVDQCCEGDPAQSALEDNIALFVNLKWKDRTRLVYANVQTLVVDGQLDDYYVNGSLQAQYLRLDLDYTTLGNPFSHPLVHLHSDGDLSPRFALEGGPSGNILVDYLEFLYRHYVPTKWLAWANRVWSREFQSSAKDDEVNPFPAIVQAFWDGQFEILRDHAQVLERIKTSLCRRKDEAFLLHMDGSDRTILEYPLSR